MGYNHQEPLHHSTNYLLIDPQIHVYSVGNITLPLAVSQAQEMIETAHRAPFGRGNQTIVDTSVRKTWELNPGKDFEIGDADGGTTSSSAVSVSQRIWAYGHMCLQSYTKC